MKLLDNAIYAFLKNDTVANNYGQGDDPESKPLETICGPVFRRPECLGKFKGVANDSNVFPRISFFSQGTDEATCKRECDFWIVIRDNNQDRLELLGERVRKILTLANKPNSRYKPILDPSVIIGMVRFDQEVDANVEPYGLEKRLKFKINYIE